MPSLRTQTTIGLFVLGGLALAVAAVTILGSGRLFSDNSRYVLFFRDSVSGLNVGAPVMFRGVKVGQVTDIRLSADTDGTNVTIPVIVEIKPFDLYGRGSSHGLDQTMDRLIANGLRGQLALHSLVTGQYYVSLDLHPKSKPPASRNTSSYPEIPTIPSSLQELTTQVSELPVQEMTRQLSRILARVDRFLASGDLEQSLASLRTTLENTEQISARLKQDLPTTLASIRSASDSANHLVGQAESDLARVSASLTQAADQAEQVLTTADQSIGPLLSSLEQTFTSAGSTLEQTRASLSQLSRLLSRDSGLNRELVQTLNTFQDAARSVENLTDYLERHPEALLRGKGGY